MRIYGYRHPIKRDRLSVKGHHGRVHVVVAWTDGRGAHDHRISMDAAHARDLADRLSAWADMEESA